MIVDGLNPTPSPWPKRRSIGGRFYLVDGGEEATPEQIDELLKIAATGALSARRRVPLPSGRPCDVPGDVVRQSANMLAILSARAGDHEDWMVSLRQDLAYLHSLFHRYSPAIEAEEKKARFMNQPPPRPARPQVLLTGYAGRDIDDFAGIVGRLDLWVLDIRKTPKSGQRGWSGEELSRLFKGRYHAVGHVLGNENYANGGPIAIVDIARGVRGIRAYLGDGKRPLLLCGCGDASRCHRTDVAIALGEAGVTAAEMDWSKDEQ